MYSYEDLLFKNGLESNLMDQLVKFKWLINEKFV